MRSPLLATAFFTLISSSAHAQVIELVCNDNTGFSVSLDIDVARNIITSNGSPARNVLIDKDVFVFTLDLYNGEWLHRINRSTGNMTVRAPDKTIIPTYFCEKANKKF